MAAQGFGTDQNHILMEDGSTCQDIKAIVGHYLLHHLYLSTYHVSHVLELNDYVVWVLALFDRLIADPAPLLAGEGRGAQLHSK